MVTSSAVVGSSAMSSVGLVGERHGDHHPLPLAAGELVRIGVEPRFGSRDADLVEQLERPRAALSRSETPRWTCSTSAIWRRSCEDRVERGHRLLEDHRDLVAANRRKRGRSQL